MPIFENARGRRLEIQLPDTEWAELQKAVVEYRTLQRERKVAGHRLDSLERDRQKAVETDKQALSKWLRDQSGPEPKANAAEKVAKEIEACKRRYDALDLALDTAGVELIDLVDEHRKEWLEEVEVSLEASRGRYEEAVEALHEARVAMSREFALRRWITQFPDVVSFRTVVPVVRTLPSLNGDPYLWDQVRAALIEDANPPARVVVPLGGTTTESYTQAT
jgi:hypothetical protein